MSGCTAATRTAFGLLRRGGKLSLSCHASSTGSSRLQAVKGRRCISRPPLAFRNAPAFTSRGGLVSLHRRHAGESPASLNSPRVSRPPFPFSETPSGSAPRISANPLARVPSAAVAHRARYPTHDDTFTDVLARTSRNNPVSRAVSSVATPPSQDAVSDSTDPTEISRGGGGDGPVVKPEFCDISEEEDVQARRIVVMEPGASVVCTAEEEKIFTTLLDVVKRYELPVTLRVAGGWVRDKLLGKHSSDIDIALDTMMGEEFAGKVNEYLKEKGEETHGVGVIQSNPDQSKHLETATMRVHGTWLDLVNLRSEEYTEASRIPEMKFGSATDDAFRRDLTINSLFYNINLRCVEDFTGMGLEDLQAGIVRTPLPPRTTFLDDPLRILRSVRFASRFGFSLDDAIVHAATDAEVQEKLRAKVSRERVGKEVQGMLRGPSPGDALSLLCRFNLFDTVFATSFPTTLTSRLPNTVAWGCLHSMRSLDAVLSSLANSRGSASFFTKELTCEEREWLVLGAFLAPLEGGEFQALGHPAGKKTKFIPVVHTVVKEALKWRVKDAEAVSTILELAADMRWSLIGRDGAELPAFTRVRAGKLLRRGKEYWRLALIMGAVLEMPGVVMLGEGEELEPWAVELAKGPPSAEPLESKGSPLHAFSATSLGEGERTKDGVLNDETNAAKVRVAAKHLALRVRTVEDAIGAMDLDGVWDMRPILDGGKVMKLTGAKGPVMKVLTERLIDWQLEHPGGTEEEATAHLLSVSEKIIAEFVQPPR